MGDNLQHSLAGLSLFPTLDPTIDFGSRNLTTGWRITNGQLFDAAGTGTMVPTNHSRSRDEAEQLLINELRYWVVLVLVFSIVCVAYGCLLVTCQVTVCLHKYGSSSSGHSSTSAAPSTGGSHRSPGGDGGLREVLGQLEAMENAQNGGEDESAPPTYDEVTSSNSVPIFRVTVLDHGQQGEAKARTWSSKHGGTTAGLGWSQKMGSSTADSEDLEAAAVAGDSRVREFEDFDLPSYAMALEIERVSACVALDPNEHQQECGVFRLDDGDLLGHQGGANRSKRQSTLADLRSINDELTKDMILQVEQLEDGPGERRSSITLRVEDLPQPVYLAPNVQ